MEVQPDADPEVGVRECSKMDGIVEEEFYVINEEKIKDRRNNNRIGIENGKVVKMKRGRPSNTSGNTKAFKRAKSKMHDFFKGFQTPMDTDK